MGRPGHDRGLVWRLILWSFKPGVPPVQGSPEPVCLADGVELFSFGAGAVGKQSHQLQVVLDGVKKTPSLT